MKAVTPRQALSQFVAVDKYSNYLPAQKRRETKEEGQTRMMDMHRRKFPMLPKETFDRIEKALHENRILGSQRAWQFGGAPIEKTNMRGYNCAFSHFNRPDFLNEAVWLLLCGCGVGFSVQKQHVAQLPRLSRRDYTMGNVHHSVGDSIEGWADAFSALFSAYLDGDDITFDYSEVRPEGSAISSTPHPAPGPEPLRRALENCRSILERVVREQGGVIRPVDAFDMVMFAAECVRSGGVRRSATIALFSPDDEDMVNAKVGDWWKTNPQRRLANISAAFLRTSTDRESFDRLMKSTREFGEPGVVFLNNLDDGYNPCVEAALNPVLRPGVVGWSMCNLTTVNVAACKDAWEFHDAVAWAARLGTMQAAYTDTTYLGPVTKEILERDALLGVSLTGIADNPKIGLDPEVLRFGALVARAANLELAAKIGIRAAARVTCVKPEGTGSLALGGVASGSTPHHAKRYLRRVEGGKATSPLVQYLRERIPEAVEVSVFNPEEVKLVFPIEIEGNPIVKANVTALQHLDIVEKLQRNWVQPGTQRGDLVHNVSNTVVVRDHEWSEVADRIWERRDTFSGIALIGATGDLDYQQAPFVAIRDDSDDPRAIEAKALFERLKAAWVPLDFGEVYEDRDSTSKAEVLACAGGACEI